MRGIVMARVLALLVVCLAVAAATAQARVNRTSDASTCTKVSFATVCPTLNTVKVSFATPKPTRASISTSVDKSFALTVLDSRYKKVHNITIRSEAPATTYNIRIMAIPKKGKSLVAIGSFATGAIGSVPATVTSANGKLLLNRVPFFPIMARAYNPCPDQQTVNGTIILGVNIFDAQSEVHNCLGDNQNPSQWGASLHSSLGSKLWWLERDITANQQLQSQALPELLNWQAVITSLYSPSQQVLENPCLTATQLFKTASSEAAGKKATVFVTTLATHPITPSKTYCMNPQNLDMLIWAFIAGGGAGIEYSTKDAGNGPDFDVSTELGNEALRLASKIKTLEPAFLTGKKLTIKPGTSSPVKVGAQLYGGIIYIVAVNTDEGTSNASFSLTGSTTGQTAAVLWEGRSVKLNKGVIADRFASQAVHIYKIVPTTKK